MTKEDNDILQSLHKLPISTTSWTLEEDQTLIDLKRSGFSEKDIEIKLHAINIFRKFGAINTRLVILRKAGITKLYKREVCKKRILDDGWKSILQ